MGGVKVAEAYDLSVRLLGEAHCKAQLGRALAQAVVGAHLGIHVLVDAAAVAKQHWQQEQIVHTAWTDTGEGCQGDEDR